MIPSAVSNVVSALAPSSIAFGVWSENFVEDTTSSGTSYAKQYTSNLIVTVGSTQFVVPVVISDSDLQKNADPTAQQSLVKNAIESALQAGFQKIQETLLP